jgi:hypothetical protein
MCALQPWSIRVSTITEVGDLGSAADRSSSSSSSRLCVVSVEKALKNAGFAAQICEHLFERETCRRMESESGLGRSPYVLVDRFLYDMGWLPSLAQLSCWKIGACTLAGKF